MTHLNETIYGAGIASSHESRPTPAGNFQNDELLANVCKHNVTRFPYELARLAQVSKPTVIRFCRRMGFDGLPDFRLQLAASLGEGLGVAVQQFGQASEQLTGQLQRIEAALGQGYRVVGPVDDQGGPCVLLYKAVDQLRACLDTLIRDPGSRRILFHGWNWAQLDEMALPPCHLLYQFLANPATRELSAAIFLYGPNTKVASVMIFDMSEEGNFERLAALALILQVLTLPLLWVGQKALGRDFMLRRNAT